MLEEIQQLQKRLADAERGRLIWKSVSFLFLSLVTFLIWYLGRSFFSG